MQEAETGLKLHQGSPVILFKQRCSLLQLPFSLSCFRRSHLLIYAILFWEPPLPTGHGTKTAFSFQV